MALSKKTALDLLAFLFPEIPRERLLVEIVMGKWSFGGHKETNPKALFRRDVAIEKTFLNRYVSRGGLKLEYALKALELEEQIRDKVLLDVGASVGGFTDCLLQRGARFIYTCDVGLNQLSWKIRKDERVRVYEKTNAMSIPTLSLDPAPDWAVADVAFRSSVSIAKILLPILRERWMLILIKPQFEWLFPPKDYKGVVPEESYFEILEKVGDRLTERGIGVRAIVPSKLRGRKRRNQEFFYLLTLEQETKSYSDLLTHALSIAFYS